MGDLDTVQVRDSHARNRDEWREKHRVAKIMKETSLGKRSNFWGAFFFILMLCVGLFLVFAVIRGRVEEE